MVSHISNFESPNNKISEDMTIFLSLLWKYIKFSNFSLLHLKSDLCLFFVSSQSWKNAEILGHFFKFIE